MATKKITYWEVGDDYSEDGRGGNYRVIGNFSSKKEAEICAQGLDQPELTLRRRGRGNWGAPAIVTKRVVIIVDYIGEVASANQKALRSQALAKLSNEEKDALGL